MPKGTVHIHTLLNPVTRERTYTTVEPGKPLSAYLNVPDDVLMVRNGLDYDDELLHDGDVLNLIVVPKGGEQGKAIGRTAIIIGATLLASAVNPFAAGTVGASLFVAGAQAAATFGAYALIPPQIDESGAGLGEQAEFQRLGSLTGSRNRINPYGVVPKVYGHRKVFPPMSAKPYTEIQGDDQFLRLMFAITEGPCQLSLPKIGDTAIGSFDSSNVFTSNQSFTDVEIEVGESPDLYASQVSETDPGATLEDTPVIRTTDTDTEEISLDVTFPQGLFGITANGQTVTYRVDFRFEYREVGTGTWLNAYPVVDGSGRTVGSFVQQATTELFRAISNQRETWRGSVSWKVPKAQYEVRVTRVEVEGQVEETAQVFDSASWTALRSITYEQPTNMPGVVQLAMRIKATDQLNGILDNFSVEVESRLATSDGSTWDEPSFNPANGTGTGGALTSNPAWVMADLLTGSATARPIDKSRLSASSFKNWADNCATEGRECNLVIDRAQTVLQTASVIGSTGRGSLGLIDGEYKIIQDTEQTTPVQHFTPRNSWGFNSTRTFPDIPHALRMNFVNPDADWETDEATVYFDGYSEDGTNCQFPGPGGSCSIATEFQNVDLQGVTSWDQAWKEGRYRLAESRLRPERYVFNADVENIVCNRGDMVRMQHDVTLWGIKSGRIKSISGSTVTLDEQVTMDGGSYNLRVRNSSNNSVVKSVSETTGTTDTLTLSDTNNIAVGDLCMFGESGTETQELKVLSIEPQGDLTARITAVDAAPEIQDADTGTIPPFDSNITTPPEDIDNLVPPEPIITVIRSERNALYPGSDGSPQLRIVVAFQPGPGNPTQFVEGRFRKQDSNAYTSFGIVEASVGTMSLTDVDKGEVYIIQIRGRNGTKASAWVEGAPHTAGADVEWPELPWGAIGIITEDLNGTYTEIPVRLRSPAKVGFDYWIRDEVNRNEISITPEDPAWDGVDIDTRKPTWGPGELNLPIEEQKIVAPEGSPIILQPGQTGIDIQFPDLDFIDDTLEVAQRTLRASMDLIAQGVNFAKPNTNAVDNITGDVLLAGTTGNLDDIQDGDTFKRVASIAVSANGIVLMEQIEGTLDDVSNGVTFGKTSNTALNGSGIPLLGQADGDLDDVDDGTTYARVNALSISAGNILMTSVIGTLDDITDGTGYAKVLATSISAGNILLVEAEGDLDDLSDGTNFQRVASTQLTAGGIVLLSVVQGDLDDVADGTNFGKVNVIQIDAGTGRISLVEALGDLDDIDNGSSFQRVAATNLTAGGLVLLAQSDGDLDDIDDGSSFGKVNIINIDAGTGRIDLFETIGDLDDIADGSTHGKVAKTVTAGVQLDASGVIKVYGPNGNTVINGGEIDTDALFANTASITNTLTMGSGGVITNTNGDYSIAPGGFFIAADGQGVRFTDGGTLAADIGFSLTSNELQITSIGSGSAGDMLVDAGNQMRVRGLSVLIEAIATGTNVKIESVSGNVDIDGTDVLIDSSDDIILNASDTIALGATGNLSLGAVGDLLFNSLPTSNPGGSDIVWNDSGTLKIT